MPDLTIDEIIAKAKTDTDNKFKNKMASLTRLTNSEVDGLMETPVLKKKILLQ